MADLKKKKSSSVNLYILLPWGQILLKFLKRLLNINSPAFWRLLQVFSWDIDILQPPVQHSGGSVMAGAGFQSLVSETLLKLWIQKKHPQI